MQNMERLYDFICHAGKLKKTLRFSEAGTNPCTDSSADHSWRVSLMAFLVADELDLKIDIERALRIALVHDIAESITGDIDARLIHSGRISRELKEKNENQAIDEIRSMLPESRGIEIHSLWKEYEEGKTKEAKFIKAIDKFETMAQVIAMGSDAFTYPELCATYPDSAVADFPELSGMLRFFKQKLRAEFEKRDIPWKKEYG